ncbi:MAG: RES domain-containing protein [Acidimicrobiales bacterium]
MLVHRVFPHLPAAKRGEPGHPLYVHPDQGKGRLDNPDLYLVRYLAVQAEAAVGEAFAGLSVWQPAMLGFPMLPDAERALGTYRLDEEAAPLLNLDYAEVLLDRHLRPTQVVARNRPTTQAWARAIFDERRWAGVSWWSYYRPQWVVIGLWATDGALTVERVESLVGHPAVEDAARTLAKVRQGL